MKIRFWPLMCLFVLSLATGCSSAFQGIAHSPSLVIQVTPSVDATLANQDDANAEELLAKYGWTVSRRLGVYEIVLPPSFRHKAGDFPTPIYWAYNNELNVPIGLDLHPYMGKKVTAILFALKEPLPEFLRPYSEARAVVITYENNIIGAWIDGRQAATACSLDRKAFHEITQRTWGEWLIEAGLVDASDELEQRLARMTPEEIVTTYYDAINRQDFQLAYATLSRAAATDYLFANLPENALYNESYAQAYDGWPETITEAILESIRPVTTVEFEVRVKMRFKKPPAALYGDGTYPWFVTLIEEIKGLGWRIQSIGTGR